MDSRLIKQRPLPKPFLLKDYLLDDLSSCSSNGFKSFPRRQCCTTTLRFLIELDLKNIKQQKKYSVFNRSPPTLLRNPSKSALSAFQTLIAAVKRLPFAAASPPESKNVKKSILPRYLSKKILMKSSFWKRKTNKKDIRRWKSFDQLLKEEFQPLDTAARSGFTAPEICSNGNSSCEVNLDLTEVKNAAVEMVKGGDVSTESTPSCDGCATNSSPTKQKQWSVNQEREQFSPVSVLDCPFDEDEEVLSPFQHTEGKYKKLMEKIQRFGSVALEPVNLAKRFGLLHDSDNESALSPVQNFSSSTIEDGDENQAELKALDLLHQFMDTLPSHGLKIKADSLVLDFFRERIIDQNLHSERQWGGRPFDDELLDEAESWVDERKPREMFLGWEAPGNREAYVKDIERGGGWRSLDGEVEEAAAELEAEVFAALFNELLLDISSTV